MLENQDDIPSSAGGADPRLSNWLTQEAARDRLAASLRTFNKAAVFDALHAAGVVTVAVSFDGGGDSGQIESVAARDAVGDVALPATEVELASVLWDGEAYVPQQGVVTLAEAVERLAWDCLESKHDGWENNEGGFGDFTFDVAGRCITVVYNERFVETETFEHQF